MGTLDTAIYAIYIRYNYLLCLQKIQLSILSELDTAINCVYERHSSLHCLQEILLSSPYEVGTYIESIDGCV